MRGSFEAASNIAVCLTFQGSAGFVGAALRMTPQPGDRDGMQCRIQSTVSTSAPSLSTSLPILASSGATPASEANAASLRTRPGWGQLSNKSSSHDGPTPGWASNAGPAGCWCSSRASSGLSSSSCLVRNRIRAVIDCRVSTVTRCSTVAAFVVVAASMRASCLRSESSRRCSGVTTIRLLSSFIAFRLLSSFIALVRRPAALTAQGLSTARMGAAVTAQRAILEHRDDLVKTRTQVVNRLHVVRTHLIPAGAPRGLSADGAAEMLLRVRPRDLAGKTMRGLAVDLVAEVRQLDRRIAKAAGDIEAAVVESGSSLTELCGIGALNAGKILGRVGSIHRFRSAAAFASYTGTAPIEASSGGVVRHRLSRSGDRLQVAVGCRVGEAWIGSAYICRRPR